MTSMLRMSCSQFFLLNLNQSTENIDHGVLSFVPIITLTHYFSQVCSLPLLTYSVRYAVADVISMPNVTERE